MAFRQRESQSQVLYFNFNCNCNLSDMKRVSHLEVRILSNV